MAKNFTDFVNSHNGRGYDVDGSFGAQCWDGYAAYCQWLGIPYSNCPYSGGARDLWEHRSDLGLLNHFTPVSSPKNGDVGVWTTIYGGGYGHVAMYYNGQWFGQNQGGAAYPSGGACFNLVGLSMPDGGILRPKALGSGLSWIIPNPSRPLSRAEMENNAKCVWGYLHAKGWSLNAVCGMLGNMQSESTINPNRWQGDVYQAQPVESQGFGLVQWTPWTNITNYLGSAPIKDYGNLECQKLDEEAETGYSWIDKGYGMSYKDFKHSTRSPEDLAIIYLTNYERPLNPYQPIRGTQAREWYNFLRNVEPVVPEGAESIAPPKTKEVFWMKIVNGLIVNIEKRTITIG